MRLQPGDSAASDIVGNLLMVVAVVVLGGAAAVVVGTTLSHSSPAPASVSLAPVTSGDGALRVAYEEGDAVSAGALRVMLARNGSALAEQPTSSWSVSGGSRLAPGGQLVVSLSPAVAPGESLRVVVVNTAANVIMLDAASTAPATRSSLPATNLTLALGSDKLTADGASLDLLTATVRNSAGALAVASIVADDSALKGGASTIMLHDDGHSPDAEGGDGVWSGSLAAAAGTAPGVYRIPLLAYDALGAPLANGSVNVTITAQGNYTGNFTGNFFGPGQGGLKSFLGTRFGVPTSSNVTALRLRNWSYDQAHLSRLQYDALAIRIEGSNNQQWTAYLTFDLCAGNVPCVTQLETYGPANDTVYSPRNGTLPLAGLDLDLLNPVGSLQFVASSGAADPTALYPASGVTSNPVFVVTFLGDEKNVGQTSPAQNAGLYGMDVYAS